MQMAGDGAVSVSASLQDAGAFQPLPVCAPPSPWRVGLAGHQRAHRSVRGGQGRGAVIPGVSSAILQTTGPLSKISKNLYLKTH